MNNAMYFILGIALAVSIGAATAPGQIGRYAIGSGAIIDTTTGAVVAAQESTTANGVTTAVWTRGNFGPRP